MSLSYLFGHYYSCFIRSIILRTDPRLKKGEFETLTTLIFLFVVMMNQVINQEYVRKIGLRLGGCSDAAQERLGEDLLNRRFLTLYCLPPVVWLAVFNDLRFQVPPEYGVGMISLTYLFMTAHWLTEQSDYPDLAMRFHVSERTVSTWVWKTVKAIAYLKSFKVSKKKRKCLF